VISSNDLIVCCAFDGAPDGYLPITEYGRAVERIRELEALCVRLDAALAAVRVAADMAEVGI